MKRFKITKQKKNFEKRMTGPMQCIRGDLDQMQEKKLIGKKI